MINGYKSILEIRLLRQQLLNQGLTEEELGPVEDHAERRMKDEVRTYVDEVVADRLAEPRNGREHELAMELRNSLNAIANRIDAGYNFDVRVGNAEPPGEDQEPDQDVAAVVELIRTASASLKFINMSGARILYPARRPDEAASNRRCRSRRRRRGDGLRAHPSVCSIHRSPASESGRSRCHTDVPRA